MSRRNDMTLGNRIKIKAGKIWEKTKEKKHSVFEQLDPKWSKLLLLIIYGQAGGPRKKKTAVLC